MRERSFTPDDAVIAVGSYLGPTVASWPTEQLLLVLTRPQQT
jgi:hypothetical protein